jgi:probable rRNA maturation factor
MLKINFVNQYDDSKEYKKIITKILRVAAKHLKLKGKNVINVILVNDEEIKRLNGQYRQIDKVTDVLSFENDDYTDELGDVFISIDKAKSQAEEYQHSFSRELAFLTVHGFLHCLGYDHLVSDDEKEMFGIQDEILNKSQFRRTK